MSQVVDDIIELFMTKGARQYGDEAVSQLAHALQCATLAEKRGAASSLIAAALLHDIGHLLDGGDEHLAREAIDARHEAFGESFLSDHFGEAVSRPVALHVDAKRYLCATDETYWASLSPASKHSLDLQGGIYGPAEAAAFARRPFADDAVALRRWDDLAKDPASETLGLDHFSRHLSAACRDG